MNSVYPRRFASVLFDLDGTLADTAPDLGRALNTLLKRHDKPALPLDLIRTHVSQGSAALTRLGFPEVKDATQFEQLRVALLDYYAQELCVDTQLFPGIEQILQDLTQAEIPWGVVTNKPGWLTEPLLQQLLAEWSPHCVVSGDTLPVRKPHPDPLIHACKLLDCDIYNSVYIGDDPRDVYAGNAAGMYTCIAKYGYLDTNGAQPELWGADFIIDQPDALPDYVSIIAKKDDVGT